MVSGGPRLTEQLPRCPPLQAGPVQLKPSWLVLMGYSRFSKDVEHGDAFWGLGWVQVVQSGDGVGDPKHDSSFHPVIHQIGVSQASWSKNGSQTGGERNMGCIRISAEQIF